MPDDPKINLIRAQRDRLAAAYHDVQVEHIVLQGVLTQTQQKLAEAEQRIADFERKKTAAMLAAGQQVDDAA